MVYLDASVVFSLYVSDSNTVEASHLVTSATETLLISALCEMETINAFALRIFRREMTADNMDIALRDLDADLRAGFL
jgi:predicted nucleic acid-binding protein